MKITNNKIMAVTVSVMIIHFILTSLIGYDIAVQIDNQMVQVVADGLMEASKSSTRISKEEVNKIFQNTETRRSDIIKKRKIPHLLISWPSKPIMTLVLKPMREGRMNMLLSKETSQQEFRMVGLSTYCLATGINSVSFGLLIYLLINLMLTIFKQFKKET